MKGRSLAELAAGAIVRVVAVVFLAYAATNSGRSTTGTGMTLNARFDLRLMPRAEFSLEADYRSMPGVGQMTDPEVMRASARFQRQIGKYVKLQLGADYDRRTGIASQSLDSWTARIGATFRIPSL